MTDITEKNTERFADLGEWHIRYHDVGEGQPIVLLHGSGPGTTAWSNFGPNIKALSRRFRVIAPDFPGWGLSDTFDPATAIRFEVNTEVVVRLLDHLKIERAAIIGNSMGGVASQTLSAHHSHRVSHCITMGAPAPGGPQLFYQPAGLTEGLKILFQTYRTPTEECMRKLVEIMIYDQAFVTGELVKERTAHANASPKHLENFLKGLATMHIDAVGQDQLVNALKVSNIPALIVHGRDDRVVPVEHSLRTAALMPRATLVVLNRCGHWAQVEHAEVFNGLVSGFLEAGIAG